MDQYIKQLLLLHSKMILPQFGAIVIANEDTGELMFNEYLTYDDGKLSTLLEKESNMSLQEAQNDVAKFVRDLKLQLNKGETYTIFQLGEFSKKPDGSFVFEGNIKTGGESASDLASGPSPTPPIIPTPSPTPKVEDVQPEEKSLPKPEEDKVEPAKEIPAVLPDPKPKEKEIEKPKAKKNTYIEKSVDGAPIVEPVKEKNIPPVIEEKKRKKSFLFWFLLIFILLIIAGSAYVMYNYEKVEEYMGWNMYEEKKTDPIAKDTEIEEAKGEVEPLETEEEILTEKEEEIEEEIEEPISEEVVPVTPTNGQHHIIIGCFEEKSNADHLVDDFRKKGFDSEIISQIGGLYFVSAQSYPTFQAADEDLSRIRQQVEGAWLNKR